MKNKAIYLVCSLLLSSNLAFASEIYLCGEKTQGGVLIGLTSKDIKKIYLNDKEIKLSNDKKFMIAFSRDEELSHTIKAIDSNNIKTEYPLKISTTKWDVQNLTGVAQSKVTPSNKNQAEIDKERTAVRGAQKEISTNLFWQEDFQIPLNSRISGNFGGQRIMNGKKMDPHLGMDIAGKTGTPIKSPANGVVTLAGMNNFFYSGNVVILDHGFGLFTIYAHMNSISSKKGDVVKQGDILGTVGSTGRVTGPHLHWGASLNGTRFDPKYLLTKNSKCEKI